MLLLFNKPFNVLCQFTDEGPRRTLREFIDIPAIYPAGRLDYDSEGLLLLTDDGRLQQRIAHPRHKLPKTYWVQVEGNIDDAALRKLRGGVQLSERGPGWDAGLEHGAGLEFGGRRQKWQAVEGRVGLELQGWHVVGVDMIAAICRRNQVLSTYRPT